MRRLITRCFERDCYKVIKCGRTNAPDPLSLAASSKADAIAWRKAFGGIRVPRGVHRFHSHEEADEWLWRMIVRPART